MILTIKNKITHAIALLLVFANTCCTAPSNGQFTIVTTTSILGDAVRHIVQDQAKVVTLMGPGIDPHTYQVTHDNVTQLIQADVIIYNGLDLEGKMVHLLDKLGKERPTYAVGKAFKKEQLILDEVVYPIGIDPHIWFDIALWKEAVQYISSKLQKHQPLLANFYEKNTQAYLEHLTDLHGKNQLLIKKIPTKQRLLITAHDAFSYFGRSYGIEVRGLQGISTVAECGLRDIADLVDTIVKRKIKAIFLETSVPDKSMRAVLEGCKKKGHQVQVGGYLYSDALGDPNSPAGTYQGMLHANVETIVNALK